MYFWYPDNALSVWILARGDNVEKTFAVLSGSFEVHAEQNGCLNIVETSILLVCAILLFPLTLVLMIWIMNIFDNLNLDLMVLQRQGLGFWNTMGKWSDMFTSFHDPLFCFPFVLNRSEWKAAETAIILAQCTYMIKSTFSPRVKPTSLLTSCFPSLNTSYSEKTLRHDIT